MAIKPKSQLEKRIDGLKAGGVGKNVGGGSEIFNNYSGNYANVIDGAYSAHAEGLQNTISSGSLGSHAEGVENSISNSAGSHVEGDFNHISSSDYSHAEGESSKIFDSKWAHAGGYGCYIMSHADCGFAHGSGAKVTGGVAAAFGSSTLAAGRNQFVAGKGNIEDSEDKYALIIGNGTEVPRGQTSFEASNALTLDWEGNLWVAGEIKYGNNTVKNYTAGKGISISEDGTISTEAKEYIEGEGIKIADSIISLQTASTETLGGVKVGKGLKISADGTLETNGGGNYTSGDGIEITEDDVINVKQATGTEIGGIILGEGLEYDSATGKTNTVPNIQQAVIIQEADAKYLLHEYTQVEYIAGNKIGYAGAQNQIIAQGYIIYKNGGTAPNGVTIAGKGSANPSELPDIPLYTDMPFSGPAYYNANTKIVRAYMKFVSAGTAFDTYALTYEKEDGTEIMAIGRLNNYNNYQYGFSFVWGGINPPGYTQNGITYDYGCVSLIPAYKVKYSATSYQIGIGGNSVLMGFASEAEYNAAVGLTYEPNTLTQVNETVTEV